MSKLKFIISSAEFTGEAEYVYMNPGDSRHLYTWGGKLAYEQKDESYPSAKKLMALIQKDIDEHIQLASKLEAEPSITVVITPTVMRSFGGD